MGYIASWSGGKDACFACYEAMRNGHSVSYLANFVTPGERVVRSHGTRAEIIGLQAEAVDIPLLQRETDWDSYERVFKETVRTVIPDGVEGVIFGDIYVQEHKDWVERVCGDLGLKAVEPLWGRETEEILLDFIDNGFKAIIVSSKIELLSEEWIGREVNRELIGDLKRNNIDPCGEHGEYHTLVTEGPIFKKTLKLGKSKTVRRGEHWFLETQEYSLQ